MSMSERVSSSTHGEKTASAVDGSSEHSDPALVSAPPVSTPPAAPTGPAFPDGGALAWTQCVGGFILYFNTWGMVSAYGAFQQFYQSEYLPLEGPSNISWIGSLQGCLMLFGNVITGPLLDQGYARTLICVGTVLIVFGMMMTSLSTQYWQIMLAQGLVVGLGNGCLFMPAIGILPTYFQKKRALAIGMAASGSSIGGVVYAIVFHRLVDEIGFGWATRIIGFIMLATQMIPLFGMKQRIKPPRARRLIDVRAFKEEAFVWFSVSAFFAFVGLYIPFFHLQEQTQRLGIVTGDLNFYLLAILNAGSWLGRVIPNAIADKVGPIETLVPCTFFAAILAYVWIAIYNTGGIVAFAILYGIFSGAYVSLSTTIAAMLSPSLQVLGTRMGMVSVPMAIGLLIGNPIGGALISRGYVAMQAFSASCTVVAAVAMLLSRVYYPKWRRLHNLERA